MNKLLNDYINHLKSSIQHYFDLLLGKEHAKIQFKENLKRVEGFPGFFYKLSLGYILKIFLFFFLVGGYKSGIDFSNFCDTSSIWFFPELLIFDIDQFLNLGIHKIILIIFLIMFANIINVIERIEKLKKFINSKKSI